MELKDKAVVEFLEGVNSVRDGKLLSLSIIRDVADWEPLIQLVFHVPQSTEGDRYVLTLSGNVRFEYTFNSENIEYISFCKCLWDEAGGEFYISLEPLRECERFISDDDEDWFHSKSATLLVERTEAVM